MSLSAGDAYKDYFDIDEVIKNIKKYLPDFNVKKFIKLIDRDEFRNF